MRGFGAGVFWGGIATVAGLAVISELTMTGDVRASLDAAAPALVAVPEPVKLPTPNPAPAPAPTPAPAVAQQPAEPQPAPQPATAPAPMPQAAQPSAPSSDPLMDQPVAPAAAPAPAASETPVETAIGDVPKEPALPIAEEPAPVDATPAPAVSEQAPELAANTVVSEPAPTAPVIDPIPETPVAADTPVTDVPAETLEKPAAIEPPPAAPADPVASEAAQPAREPVKPAEPAPAVAAVVATPEPVPAMAEPEPQPAAEPEPVPVIEPAPAAPAVKRSLPQIVAVAPDPDAPTADVPMNDATDPAAPAADTFTTSDQPNTLAPAPGFTKVVPGVMANRLPRIGTDPAPEAVEQMPEPDMRPVARFAAAFENPEARPVFAIVLIDKGLSASDRDKVAGLPFPISVAIDPLAPDAAATAEAYRAAGREVVMLATGIPEGAAASDIAVTFQSNAEVLPEAVAVLDIEQGGFQGNRPLATMVVPAIKDQGRAVITWDQGLNAGDQVARREAVPAGVVFRRVDDGASDIAAIRRNLDKAAFKAGQVGRVIVVADAGATSLAALVVWVLEGRGAELAIAPVTAALTTPE